MTTAVFPGASNPMLIARLAGVFYLLTIGTAFSEIVRTKVVVYGDAAATAHNIIASESVYRLAFAANLVGLASYIAVTLLLYVLFKPVNRNISLLAALFSIVGIATQAMSSLAFLTPLLLLKAPPYLSAFSGDQVQAMARFAMTLYGQAFNIALVFFGIYCALLGYLIYRSAFIPRTVGVLMGIAGLGYLVNSFMVFLSPALARQLTDFVYVTGMGELAFTLWLLVMGVNVASWQRKWQLAQS